MAILSASGLVGTRPALCTSDGPLSRIAPNDASAMGRSRPAPRRSTCFDPDCWSDGFASMIGDQRRQHAIQCRLPDLATLVNVRSRPWQLDHLERKASEAEAAADRIRQIVTKNSIKVGAYPKTYADMRSVLTNLREAARAGTAWPSWVTATRCVLPPPATQAA